MASGQGHGDIEFFNFLKKYDLDHYYERLKAEGVKKINHLQHVKNEDLEKIGMTKPERQRLRGKYEQHFSKLGKLKVCLQYFFCCSYCDCECTLTPPLINLHQLHVHMYLPSYLRMP